MKFNNHKLLIILFIFFCPLCNSVRAQNSNTIASRFDPPKGYSRSPLTKESFAYHLRNLPLKKEGSLVSYYDGMKKNNTAYCAVIDLPIGDKNLHQCADAVMRLRADYFFKLKQYNLIHFNFTNGFRVDYSKWNQGFRIAVKGNKTSWIKKVAPSNTYEDYWAYLEQIFQFAGTASLEKELKPIAVSQMQIGDVFIKGGFPGHAVIIVDMAVNSKGQKVFMLAQSYMPAQELQILKNPNNSSLSPWYNQDFGSVLETPEWIFNSNQLKRF